MAVGVVQERERATAEHGPAPGHEAARDQAIAVDGLAMPGDIEGGGRPIGAGGAWPPQGRRPCGEDVGEGYVPVLRGDLRQEVLHRPIAVGAAPPGEQRQAVPGVAAQIPGTSQAKRREKEQRLQQHAADRRRGAGEAGAPGDDWECYL